MLIKKSASLSSESKKIQKGSGNWRKQEIAIRGAITPEQMRAVAGSLNRLNPKQRRELENKNKGFFALPEQILRPPGLKKPITSAEIAANILAAGTSRPIHGVPLNIPSAGYVKTTQAYRRGLKEPSPDYGYGFLPSVSANEKIKSFARFSSETTSSETSTTKRPRPKVKSRKASSPDVEPMYGPEQAYGPWQNPNLPSQRSLPKNHPLMQTIRQLENPRARTTASLPQQIKMLRFLQTQPQYANQANARLKYLKRQQMMRGALVAANVVGWGGLANNYFNRPN